MSESHNLLQISESLKRVIAPLFPMSANITWLDDKSPSRFHVVWKLHDAPERPSKQSKIINITIDNDFLDDYADGPDSVRKRYEQALFQFVASRVEQHDPSNERSVHAGPEVVVWDFPHPDL